MLIAKPREDLQTLKRLEILPDPGGLGGELRNWNSNGPDKPREDLQTLQWLEILPGQGA